jgi:hypothetical protein
MTGPWPNIGTVGHFFAFTLPILAVRSNAVWLPNSLGLWELFQRLREFTPLCSHIALLAVAWHLCCPPR